jgi:hypothetical protein
VAVIMPDPDRKWDSFMRDADGNYRHFSYRIKFVDPVTENAKIWKQGMWTGNFIEADEAMTALVKGKSVHTLAGRTNN